MLNLHLLEFLSLETRCLYLSDLRSLSPSQRKGLLHKLESIEPKDEDIREWNEVLDYLTSAPPENTAELAHLRLMEFFAKTN